MLTSKSDWGLGGPAARFALYWAPAAGSALDRLGVAWLGRDARGGSVAARPTVDGWSEHDLDRITDSPRHYGFHATLKAPFRPAPGVSPQKLLAETERFAAAEPPVALPPLDVVALDGFLALGPTEDAPGVTRLASACVRDIDVLRASLAPDEVTCHSRGGTLSQRQRAHLERWGYPYVMEDFRFQMTLTDRLGAQERAALVPPLRALFAPALAEALSIDALSVFAQPGRATPFREIARVPLTGREEA